MHCKKYISFERLHKLQKLHIVQLSHEQIKAFIGAKSCLIFIFVIKDLGLPQRVPLLFKLLEFFFGHVGLFLLLGALSIGVSLPHSVGPLLLIFLVDDGSGVDQLSVEASRGILHRLLFPDFPESAILGEHLVHGLRVDDSLVAFHLEKK